MKTKYPIILVHGVALKDIGFLKSFGRIDSILKQEGFDVFKSKVDSFGTIENNAIILKNEIDAIIDELNCDKVNIIAHSKGGLDAKYMIENLDMGDKVASLTTLCTPHKGSPIASGILKFPRWILKFIAFWINFWYRLFGDKKPDALRVCEQLAVISSIEEETFKLSELIYCQSYSTKMKKSRDDFIMGIPLMFSHYYEKDINSDGMVNEESAKFGDYKGMALDDSISHSEIVDFMVKKKKREKIYSFYSYLCEDLVKKGF